MGGAGSTTSTSYTDQYNRVYLDKSMYSNISAIYFQATLQQVGGAGNVTVYAKLVDEGGTDVTGGELSASIGAWSTSKQISADIKSAISSSNEMYRMKIKVSAGEGLVVTGSILIEVYV